MSKHARPCCLKGGPEA
ncbi:unnamed protein product [Chondrus crispus]|uniref:Uncharacterized protein n=1 Tax=Chondrus crispus TaxID=2769 RepID=R7QF98_CHOCR|nr:unnamed protein product [Chondrus crispus]XP_005716126.1 unnamed protein product [Chondrus crispus]CDF36116.1 unnamed protein product [Chondrus crispus]CDF36307.1 unnamed protein product [Chondrus crispus]|eukprot:XP_005715935.1 unnamed protein product [Chondrus crispus]